MSDARAKAERSKAKDARQLPAPEYTPPSPAKKDKPFIVQYRFKKGHFMEKFGWCEWSKFGAYRTQEIAETAIKNDKRKSDYYEYRIL